MGTEDFESEKTVEQDVLQTCVSPLLAWYRSARRTLPFREEPSPYHIWVSEIMLQQTRVSAAVPYFERFVRELPDIASLAACDEEKLLKLWQGLGYYNRVRNLQKGARQVCERFGGELPRDYEALRSIVGIGDYTAGAIGSIAFGLKTPAVDGNVLRVVSRITGDLRDVTEPSLRAEYASVLRPLMPDGEESDFTQALMELGALVCVPNGAPLCDACPLAAFCVAKREALTDTIPLKRAKKARRIEHRCVYMVVDDLGRVLLSKRPKKGLLAGLWEFPNHLVSEECPPALRGLAFSPFGTEKHIFSHVEWHMQGYFAEVKQPLELSEKFAFVSISELEEQYAIPGAFSAFYKELVQRTKNG